MNNILTPTVKRYILSSLVTFLSTFFLLIGTNLSNLNGQTLTMATILGLILVAGRAAFKAVIEAVAGGHADLPSIGTPTV